MKNTAEYPELLSPAGDMEKLKTAFAFGADAVYAGIPKFSLRTRETGFTTEKLKTAVEYAHNLGKKIYITINIYPHNLKIKSFLKELDQLAELQPDGLIVADPGIVNTCIKKYPQIPVHLSTQANNVNYLSTQFWSDLGVERVILSRELRLSEISEIKEQVPSVDLEAFVHGAICISYSGRCLISNYLHFRDANQGTCTNSCRWEYKLAYEKGSLLDIEAAQTPMEPANRYIDGVSVTENFRPNQPFPLIEDENGTYMMNAKDLCAIELIPDIIKAGIMSLKIEGRTKSAYYNAVTARSYRRAIDDHMQGKPFNPQHLRDLMTLSNRGYTSGFYSRNPRQYGENFEDGYSAGMPGIKLAAVVKNYDPDTGLAEVVVKNRFSVGNKMEMFMPDRSVPFNLEAIMRKNGDKVDTAHGGAQNMWIPLPEAPHEFTFIRILGE